MYPKAHEGIPVFSPPPQDGRNPNQTCARVASLPGRPRPLPRCTRPPPRREGGRCRPAARAESRHELEERPPPRGRQEAAREVGGRRCEGEGRCAVAGCRGRIAARLASAASGEKGPAGPSLRAEEAPPGRRPRAEKLAGEQRRGRRGGLPGVRMQGTAVAKAPVKTED